MRVHMRNVISSAIERGIVSGYQQAMKTAKLSLPRKKSNEFLNTLLANVWNSLDDIIDFTDPDEHEPERKQIGFQAADAVGHQMVPRDDEYNEEDDE